ncbi:MAG: hypothetical protein HGA23_12245 [Bacteroidales bacterium]|nr:hypothetical protein [Bacteroidales bacterium]
MRLITFKNYDRIVSPIAFIMTLPAIWALLRLNIIYLNFTYTLTFYLIAGLLFLTVFFCLRYFIGGFILVWMFDVIPWTYGVYSNNEFGFSAHIPLEFTNMPELHPPEPGLIIHARDKSKFGAITIFAGSHYYGHNPSIGDIETLEKRTMENIHARLESMERISVDNTDAVRTISEIQSIRTKKIIMIKDGVEFIIICSAPEQYFAVFDPAFEKLFNTLSWTPKK